MTRYITRARTKDVCMHIDRIIVLVNFCSVALERELELELNDYRWNWN